MNAPIYDFKIMAVSALVPLVIGSLWYSNLVAGKAWMKASGMTDEKVKSGNMVLIFGLTYLFSFFIAIVLGGAVIHQNGIFSMFQGQEANATALAEYLNQNYAGWDLNFRSFKHGALHGFLTAFFMIVPVIAINALFERKKFGYIWVHGVYWLISATIMGGIICQFSK